MKALLSPRAYTRTISIGLPPHTVENDSEGVRGKGEKKQESFHFVWAKVAVEVGLSEVTVCEGVLRCHGKVGIESE